jgi:hypothetical protein
MRGLSLAILTAATAWAGTAISEDAENKQAVNYVFSGNIEGRTPQLLSSRVYYMKEIKPDSVVIHEHNRKISFEGDSTIVEHTFEGLLKIEKDTKNTITLRGDIERTKDALKLIFTKYCLPTSR